ncbi:MAG: hypothetical protein QY307_00090 [Acidimicrobiia bacterium]|nr:MAG: hypothetical protein QY307_00090 [Acidimicrobiia bacterium]
MGRTGKGSPAIDIAVNLVESYLRLNGYLTLSEFAVQARDAHGKFETVTDVDIMAVRFPGPVFAGDPHDGDEAHMLTIDDPDLMLEDGLIDVIIGEVKQGTAQFNPGIRRHAVLHTVLRRIEWMLGCEVSEVVARLAEAGVCEAPARGGGTIRVRLVAFGRSDVNDLQIIGLSHVVTAMLGFLSGHDDAFRPVQFRDPAPAMLSLLLKTGFEVSRRPEPQA